ncbi:toll/interleukin-1 receptor domain-containing protein [Bradyrhizobium sp. USDA 4451]
MSDFFVSYTSADAAWAEWISFILEEEGWSVTVQAWDFRPGSNFVLEMQKAASEAARTIMVLSPDYLKSQFASPEWAAAFVQDPKGLERKVVPVMVRSCKPAGLLTSIVHINLVGADEKLGRKRLLDGINAARTKPLERPAFPGGGTIAHQEHKPFPGPASPVRSPVYVPEVKRSLTDADRRRFGRHAFDLIRSHFATGLKELAEQTGSVECDFQRDTSTEFEAEVFLDGKSVCRCRVWFGGMLSNDGISYAEGQTRYVNNACNEILAVSDEGGNLYLKSILGAGFGQFDRIFDLKRLDSQQAAAYLWRRFVSPLER